MTLAEVIVEVRVTLEVPRLHAVPPFSESPTVPTNPLTEATRIVETPGAPTLTINAFGVGITVKSWTLTVKIAK